MPELASSRWTMSPCFRVDRRWESNPRIDLGARTKSSSRWTMQPICREVRPGIEPGLPPYHGGVLPKHLQTIVQ